MKARIYNYLFCVMAASILITSCDEHEQEDLSWHSWQPGMVYCANGEVTDFDKCMADGNTPKAVIFYIDDTGEIPGKAYAVSLHDNWQEAFSDPDTIYVAQGTSADITAYDGEENTTALRYGKIESPMATAVSDKYFIPLWERCSSSIWPGTLSISPFSSVGVTFSPSMRRVAGTGRVPSVRVPRQTGHGVSAFIPGVLKALTSTPRCPSVPS